MDFDRGNAVNDMQKVKEAVRMSRRITERNFRSEIEHIADFYDGRVPREWIDAVHNVLDVMEKDPDETNTFWEEPDRVDWRDR